MSNQDITLTEQKKRRGLTVYPKNPFVVGGMVKAKTKRITNKRGDMMVVGETGELSRPLLGSGRPKKWTRLNLSSSTLMAFEPSKNLPTRAPEF